MFSDGRIAQLNTRLRRTADPTDATQYMAEHWYVEDVVELLSLMQDLHEIAEEVLASGRCGCPRNSGAIYTPATYTYGVISNVTIDFSTTHTPQCILKRAAAALVVADGEDEMTDADE